MEHPQDLDGLATDPVGHDAAGLQHDKFARPRDPAGPPHAGLLRQHRNRFENTLNGELRSSDSCVSLARCARLLPL